MNDVYKYTYNTLHKKFRLVSFLVDVYNIFHRNNVNYYKCYHHMILYQMQTQLEQQLSGCPEAVVVVQSCCNEFTMPFTGLETHHKQQKFYRENFDLLVSM